MIISFVIYDPVTGELLGGFMQAAPEDGTPYFEVDANIRMNWFSYRMNAARDGLELIPPPPPPSQSELDAQAVSAYMAVVQAYMERQAQSFGYDNLLSIISYADEPTVARYQVEGLAFRVWRSLVWQRCENLLAEVKAGARIAPTDGELIDLLPAAPVQQPLPQA